MPLGVPSRTAAPVSSVSPSRRDGIPLAAPPVGMKYGGDDSDEPRPGPGGGGPDSTPSRYSAPRLFGDVSMLCGVFSDAVVRQLWRFGANANAAGTNAPHLSAAGVRAVLLPEALRAVPLDTEADEDRPTRPTPSTARRRSQQG